MKPFQFIAAFLLILSGECLKYTDYEDICFSLVGRVILGFTFSIAHLTVVIYASETTTKKIRIGLLSFIGYINAMAVLLIASLANRLPQYLDMNINDVDDSGQRNASTVAYDDGYSSYDDEGRSLLIAYSGLIIIALAATVLVAAPFLVRESTPFLIRKRNDEAALKEYKWVRCTEKNGPNIRHDFEMWKDCVLAAPQAQANIFRKENLDSLRLMCSTRLLSLFFNSVIITAIFIRLLNYDTDAFNTNGVFDYKYYNEEHAIELLVGCKFFQIMIGLVLMVISIKWNIDRFCYKLSFVCGMCACVVYVVDSCLDYLVSIPSGLVTIVLQVVITAFLMLPMRMEIFSYSQIAEAFPDSNAHKVWTIVFVNCIEHLIHIFLMLQIFLFFSYAILLTGFGILYLSYWLMKYAPKVIAVDPAELAAQKDKRWEFLKHTYIVHM